MIVGPLLVLCVAYYARGALAARSQTPVLDARDAETLKSVFFSGEPWLVECTSAKRPSAAFFDVEKLMAAQPVASEVHPNHHLHPSPAPALTRHGWLHAALSKLETEKVVPVRVVREAVLQRPVK